jgi:fatty acid desaturase
MQTNPERSIQQYWEPKPIDPPKPDPEIKKMSGPQRSAEVIRYSLLSFEYWLSPLGRLREWIRLNSKLSMILLIPGVLVMPLITWIIYLVAGWVAMLVGLAGNLIVLPIAVLLAGVCFSVVIRLLRSLLGR